MQKYTYILDHYVVTALNTYFWVILFEKVHACPPLVNAIPMGLKCKARKTDLITGRTDFTEKD